MSNLQYYFENEANKYFIKTLTNNYSDNYATTGTTGILATPNKSVREEVIELLRYDYDIRRTLTEMLRIEVLEQLRQVLAYDGGVKDMIRSEQNNLLWGPLFAEAVLMAMERLRDSVEGREGMRTRINDALSPIPPPKSTESDRAVKLV